MNSPTRSMDARAWLLLMTLALLWGSSFFYVELSLIAYGPMTVVLARVVFLDLAVILVSLLLVDGRLPRFLASLWRRRLVRHEGL